MKKELSKEEIKNIQMEILKSIHLFCVEHNLRYSLAYGTLLGAIRHKGYIPWDDDVDIMMPRPDYERFIKEYSNYESKYTVQTHINDPSYFLAFAKVYDNRTELVIFPTKTGVFVDVFPIDGLPDSEEETQRYYERRLKLIFKNILYTCKNNAYRPGNKLLNFFKYVCKRVLYPSRKKAIKQLKDMELSFPFEQSNYAGVVTDIDVWELNGRCKREVFENYTTASFEGHKFSVIEDYHALLCNQ